MSKRENRRGEANREGEKKRTVEGEAN
jgi:hypothetical protein